MADKALRESGIEISDEDPTERFDLVEVLGRGSYGEVYKGMDKTTGEIVAVKIISIEEDDDELASIRAEVEILASCDHPNVVRYVGTYFKEDYLWIIIEYCGGGSVADLMQITGRPLTETQIAVIARECLQGLAYLHENLKIHRDIKGGNVLINDRGEVKLADFGVSAQLSNTLSKRASFIGTPFWMAPEVISENQYDGTADIWSLGITLIEMAETLPPRSNVHPMRVLFMIPRDPPPRLSCPQQHSPQFVSFVARCLTKDPALRPCAEVLLDDPFVSEAHHALSNMGPEALQGLVDDARRIVEERGYRVEDEDGDDDDEDDDDDETVSESDTGTMVRRGRKDSEQSSTSSGASSMGTFVYRGGSDAGTFVHRRSEASAGTTGTFVHRPHRHGRDDSVSSTGTFVHHHGRGTSGDSDDYASSTGTFVRCPSELSASTTGTFVYNPSEDAGTFVDKSGGGAGNFAASNSGTFVDKSSSPAGVAESILGVGRPSVAGGGTSMDTIVRRGRKSTAVQQQGDLGPPTTRGTISQSTASGLPASRPRAGSHTVASDPTRGFGLGDEVLQLYRRDNAIQLPFLHTVAMDPERTALGVPQADLEEAIAGLDPDGGPGIPAIASKIAASPVVSNLAASLAVQLDRQQDPAASARKIERIADNIADLEATIKTILRV